MSSAGEASLRIGVSQNFMHADPDRAAYRDKTLQYTEERMALSIYRAGALPLPLLALGEDAGSRALIEQIDGLILAGGADVAPPSYGETPLQPEWAGDAVRDAYEIRLVELAIEARRPVLGLCRGAQLLNVAFGGTLWQDIATQVENSLPHRDGHRYDELGHPIRVDPDSWVGGLHGGATDLEVNSIHHQGLRRIAPGFRETAWSPDGMVEAVEWIDHDRWVVGVQWHPEWLETPLVAPGAPAAGRADGSRIFEGFLAACRHWTSRP